MIIIAKEENISELSKLRVLYQKEDYKERYPNNDKDLYIKTKKYLEEHLNKDIYIFIEIIDEKIVGTCALQIINYMPTCLKSGIEGYICDVFTLKEYRKNGICTNLVKKCIEFAKEKNVVELKLTCDIPNARRLYEKLGFEKEAYIMKKKIQEKNKDG